jgi:hypothetical protein
MAQKKASTGRGGVPNRDGGVTLLRNVRNYAIRKKTRPLNPPQGDFKGVLRIIFLNI